MNDALIIINMGLRASIAVSGFIVMCLYARYFANYLRDKALVQRSAPPLRNAVGIFGMGLAFIGFMGKFVVMTAVMGYPVSRGRGAWDEGITCACFVATSIGLMLFTSANFEYRGRPRWAYFSSIAAIGAGIAFALFYGATHQML